MTPMEEALIRDVLVQRTMNLTGDMLTRVAEASGLDVCGFLSGHRAMLDGAKEAAHPHSENAGKPWPGDGSDYSDLPARGQHSASPGVNTDRANVAAWGASQRQEADQ